MAGSTCNTPAVGVRWIELTQPPSADYVDPWMRTIGIDGEERIYVTAVLAGSQDVIAALAAEDHTKTMTLNSHLYVPAAWLATLFPEVRETCRTITQVIRRHYYDEYDEECELMTRRFTVKPGARKKHGMVPDDLNVSEAQDQMTFMQWLQLNHPRVYEVTHHSPNGEKRDKFTGVKLKRMGTKPGFPDLVTFLPAGSYRGLVVEMKRPGEMPSEAQEFWLRHFEHLGYWVAVVVGYDAAVLEYQKYLAMLEPTHAA